MRICSAAPGRRTSATRQPARGRAAASVPWPGYHVDHATNSHLPPSTDWNRFGYVNTAVYLHDVELDGAPMLVCPRSHALAPSLYSRLFADGIMAPGSRGGIPDLREAEELMAPVPAVGKKGSVLLCKCSFPCRHRSRTSRKGAVCRADNSYLVHAAQPFENKRVQRAFWTLSVCRADTAEFNKLSNPWDGPDRDYMLGFAKSTTPRVLELFDTEEVAKARAEQGPLPAAGHEFYTEQTLGLMEHWLPEVDLEPYRAAMAQSKL